VLPSVKAHLALEAQLRAAQEQLAGLQKEVLDFQRYHLGGGDFDFGPNNMFLSLAGRCVRGLAWV